MGFVFYLLVILHLAIGCFAASAKRPFENKDALSITYLDDIVVSPSGRHAAYVQTKTDNTTYESSDSLWLIEDIDANTSRKLAHVSHPQFSWSPDESLCCWVNATKEADSPQLHCSKPDEIDSPTIFTNLEGGIDSYIWSADSKHIAILTKISSSVHVPDNVQIFTNAVYGSGNSYAQYFKAAQIWTLDIQRGRISEPQLLATLNTTTEMVSWSADSSAVLYTVARAAEPYYGDGTVELRSTQIADKQLLWSKVLDGPTDGFHPNPECTKLAFMKPDPAAPPEFAQLDASVFDIATGETDILTKKYDFDLLSIAWGGNQTLFALTAEMGNTALVEIDISTKEIAHWRMDNLTSRKFGVSTRKQPPRILASAASSTAPAELYEVHKSSAPRALTDIHAWFRSTFDLEEPQYLQFKGPGGQQVHGYVHLPPEFSPEKKYPLIALAHGGPFDYWDPAFMALRAPLYQAGYIVLSLNPRGSSSYGQAFAGALKDRWPGLDADDTIAAVQYLVATREYIDDSKLAIIGGSAGASLVDWTATHSDLFSAAISFSDIADFEAYWLIGDQPDSFANITKASQPWKDPASANRSSVNFVSSSTTTPTLFIMGDKDFRTPPALGSLPMFRLFKYYRIPTALVILEGAGHAGGGNDMRFSGLINQYALKWLDKNLHGKEVEEFDVLGVQ